MVLVAARARVFLGGGAAVSFPEFAFWFVAGFAAMSFALFVPSFSLIRSVQHGYHGDFERYHRGLAFPRWWAWRVGAWFRARRERRLERFEARWEARVKRRERR